jgi:cell division protein FtsB
MVTDLFSYLVYPVRVICRAALPLGLCVVFGYLVLNGIYSERGYLNMQKNRDTLHQANGELALLRDERIALEHRVTLLKGEAVGRDLLEEEARRVLNLAHPDEVVVRMPPTASRLYSAENPPPSAGTTGSRN